MPSVIESVEMEAPPDRIAAFFVPQRMVYWYGAEMAAELEVLGGAADFCAGQKVRIRGKMGRREVSLTAVVTRFEPGHTLEWQFRDEYGIRGMQRWDITPMADGSTRVSMLDDYSYPGGRLAQWWSSNVTSRAVSARNRAWLEKLRSLAERESE
jgi:hypothetical protein